MPKSHDLSLPIIDGPEPRWPAFLAVLAAVLLYAGLPEFLSLGPWWLLLGIVVVLSAALIVTHRLQRHRINIVLGYILSAVLTLFLMWSIVLLVTSLPGRREPPVALLRAGGALWLTNILVFASWYWRLDAGGPHGRERRPTHERGAFLFPQMMMHPDRAGKDRPWSPRFVDYLFLAFNTSTAFSPTDTAPLSRWAKAMMMVQSVMSLVIIAVLIGRSVNIL